MPPPVEQNRIPDSFTRDKPKSGRKQSKGRRRKQAANQGVDIAALFNDPQGFFQRGLDTNGGKRRVPRPQPSNLDWIQEHGPVGNTKADGTKATRAEIVRANQNDLNRRNTPDLGLAQAAVQERKNAQQMQAGQPGLTAGDEAFRVAFGKDGAPVGFATPAGSARGANMTPADEGLNKTGNFTDVERANIRASIANAPSNLVNPEQNKVTNSVSSNPVVTKPALNYSGVDLNAVFPSTQGKGNSVSGVPATKMKSAANQVVQAPSMLPTQESPSGFFGEIADNVKNHFGNSAFGEGVVKKAGSDISQGYDYVKKGTDVLNPMISAAAQAPFEQLAGLAKQAGRSLAQNPNTQGTPLANWLQSLLGTAQ